MIPVIVGTAAVCLIWKARPSTLVRVIEDTGVAIGKYAKRKVTNSTNKVRVEYRARQIDAAQRAIAKEAKRLRELTPEQRKRLAKDDATIMARAAELKAQREGHVVVKPRRASRAGSKASSAYTK